MKKNGKTIFDTDFITLSDSKKEQYLMHGLEFMTGELSQNSLSLRRLLVWLNCFNGLAKHGEVDITDLTKLKDICDEFRFRLDEFISFVMLVSVQIGALEIQKHLQKVEPKHEKNELL